MSMPFSTIQHLDRHVPLGQCYVRRLH